ncbi:CpaD family pilus assembly lipoprotein [Vibrio ostreicida]|uniref:CpaD family pilus assembly lipoprotein n=1 Tax=Vibrio ostreicida TaxID=526588 RepID=A0ABT8C1P3_9VIBR|nr:CpaD family pilus assembly lipoprotein [Vibrio ostreicida]MDN3612280.1 CpaD family pilus assembly lipoprotein [Vibrio ostreicida]NPD08663.1 hypothetical protein [Vibrio ostreicida]
MKLTPCILLLSVALGGCASESLHRQPAIDVVSVSNTLTLTVENNQLSSSQQQDIEAFISQRGQPYGLRIKLLSYSDKGAAQVATIKRGLVTQGVAQHQMVSERTKQLGSGDIQIIVESFRAKVNACHTGKLAPVVLNQYKSHPSYGCTNAAALAQMVANPKDLIVGEPLGPTNGAKAVAAVEAYVAPATANNISQNSGSALSEASGGN